MPKVNSNYFFLILLFLVSCGNSVFEEKRDFKNEYWLWKEPVEFSFSIDNTEVAYNLNLFVRNSIDYEYQNIYIQYYLEDSTGNVLHEKLHNLIIFDPKTGRPIGSGAGDTYDTERTFLSDYKFEKEGSYRLRLDQFMRQDTLKNIQAVGFKITESKPED